MSRTFFAAPRKSTRVFYSPPETGTGNASAFRLGDSHRTQRRDEASFQLKLCWNPSVKRGESALGPRPCVAVFSAVRDFVRSLSPHLQSGPRRHLLAGRAPLRKSRLLCRLS